MKHKVFENKRCFITGATGGIGRHLAMKMAENNCDLLLTSAHITKLKELKKELQSRYRTNCKIFCEQGNFNNVQDIKRLIKVAKEKLANIDILINCAGVFVVKSLFDSKLKDFETSFNINLRAAFMFSQAFSGNMIKNKWGRIINIGSSSAYVGCRNTSLYCASKHALLGFSKSLHDELKEHNIRVFCVSPSGTKTEMGKLIENQNFNTFLNPEEIADYVAYISSFDAEMISEEIRLNRVRT